MTNYHNSNTNAFEELTYGVCVMFQQWQESFLKKNGRIPSLEEEDKWVKRTSKKWGKRFEVTKKDAL